MGKLKRGFGRTLYVVARHLPESNSRIKIGKVLRRFCGKLILAKCGKKVNIEKNAVFASSVELGDRSGIGINCRIAGKVIIGNDVMIGPNVSFYPTNYAFNRLDIPMNQQGFSPEKPIIVEDDVWIGANSVLLGGVTIGSGCVIGAGSVVTKSTPPYSVVAGNPAKVIKYREGGLL